MISTKGCGPHARHDSSVCICSWSSLPPSLLLLLLTSSPSAILLLAHTRIRPVLSSWYLHDRPQQGQGSEQSAGRGHTIPAHLTT